MDRGQDRVLARASLGSSVSRSPAIGSAHVSPPAAQAALRGSTSSLRAQPALLNKNLPQQQPAAVGSGVNGRLAGLAKQRESIGKAGLGGSSANAAATSSMSRNMVHAPPEPPSLSTRARMGSAMMLTAATHPSTLNPPATRSPHAQSNLADVKESPPHAAQASIRGNEGPVSQPVHVPRPPSGDAPSTRLPGTDGIVAAGSLIRTTSLHQRQQHQRPSEEQQQAAATPQSPPANSIANVNNALWSSSVAAGSTEGQPAHQIPSAIQAPSCTEPPAIIPTPVPPPASSSTIMGRLRSQLRSSNNLLGSSSKEGRLLGNTDGPAAPEPSVNPSSSGPSTSYGEGQHTPNAVLERRLAGSVGAVGGQAAGSRRESNIGRVDRSNAVTYRATGALSSSSSNVEGGQGPRLQAPRLSSTGQQGVSSSHLQSGPGPFSRPSSSRMLAARSSNSRVHPLPQQQGAGTSAHAGNSARNLAGGGFAGVPGLGSNPMFGGLSGEEAGLRSSPSSSSNPRAQPYLEPSRESVDQPSSSVHRVSCRPSAAVSIPDRSIEAEPRSSALGSSLQCSDSWRQGSRWGLPPNLAQRPSSLSSRVDDRISGTRHFPEAARRESWARISDSSSDSNSNSSHELNGGMNGLLGSRDRGSGGESSLSTFQDVISGNRHRAEGMFGGSSSNNGRSIIGDWDAGNRPPRGVLAGLQDPRELWNRESGVDQDRPPNARPRSGLLGRERRSSNSGLPFDSRFGSVGSPAREGEMGSSDSGTINSGLPTTSPSGVSIPGAQDFQARFRAQQAARDAGRMSLVDALLASREATLRQAEEAQVARAIAASLGEDSPPSPTRSRDPPAPPMRPASPPDLAGEGMDLIFPNHPLLSLLAGLGRHRPSDQLMAGGPMGMAELLAALRAGLEEANPSGVSDSTALGGSRRGLGGRALLIHAGAGSGLGGGERGTWFLGIPGRDNSLHTLALGGDGGGLGLEALLGLDNMTYERLTNLEDVKTPAPSHVIDSLRVTHHSATSNQGHDAHGKPCGDAETCAICIQEYEPGEAVMHLPCKHAYHEECVKGWLSTYSKVCPVCKASVTGE